MEYQQPQNHSESDCRIFQYIVVGGGVSGLQSAQIVSAKTNNFIILEAQQELGGKIGTMSLTDFPAAKHADWIVSQLQSFKKCKIQKGGTWTFQRHGVLKQFCRMHSIPLKVQYCEGSAVYLAYRSYTTQEVLQNAVYATQIHKFISQIDHLADQYKKHVLDSAEVTETYKQLLKKYDSMTVRDYLNLSVHTQAVRVLIEDFLQHTECTSADLNSMHEVLTKHARSNDVGILKEFLGIEGYYEPWYIIQGTHLIIEKYVQSIQKKIKNNLSEVIKFNSQVIDIDNTKKQLCIVTYMDRENKAYKAFAKKVICAAPLQVLRNISFSNISENKRLVFDNQARTSALKIFFVVKKPFWRNKNYSGDGLFSNDWTVNICHDVTPNDQSCGMIVFFQTGSKFQKWKSMFSPDPKKSYEQKKQYIINVVANMFNIKKDTEQFEQSFKDCFIGETGFMQNPFIKSGYQSNTSPGTFTRVVERGGDLSALYGDEQNLVFVGSEFSDSFASYIEGGLRAARKKVFKLIGQQDPLKRFMEEGNVVIKK